MAYGSHSSKNQSFLNRNWGWGWRGKARDRGCEVGTFKNISKRPEKDLEIVIMEGKA